MKIANRNTHQFSTIRLKKTSAREFIEHHFDSSHVPIVMEMAEELNLSTEESTAYALAMFNTIQDLINMHHHIELPGMLIKTLHKVAETDKQREFVYHCRESLKQPYIKNAAKVWLFVKSRLKTKVRERVVVTKKKQREIDAANKKRESEQEKRLMVLRKKAQKEKKKKAFFRKKRRDVGLF